MLSWEIHLFFVLDQYFLIIIENWMNIWENSLKFVIQNKKAIPAGALPFVNRNEGGTSWGGSEGGRLLPFCRSSTKCILKFLFLSHRSFSQTRLKVAFSHTFSFFSSNSHQRKCSKNLLVLKFSFKLTTKRTAPDLAFPTVWCRLGTRHGLGLGRGGLKIEFSNHYFLLRSSKNYPLPIKSPWHPVRTRARPSPNRTAQTARGKWHSTCRWAIRLRPQLAESMAAVRVEFGPQKAEFSKFYRKVYLWFLAFLKSIPIYEIFNKPAS